MRSDRVSLHHTSAEEFHAYSWAIQFHSGVDVDRVPDRVCALRWALRTSLAVAVEALPLLPKPQIQGFSRMLV